MHCPFCKNTDTKVLDSRVADEGGAIRRRRVVRGVREALHHDRADAAHDRQAVRRHRAVRPRQGHRRRRARRARVARSRPTTWRVSASRSRTPCATRGAPRSPPTRSAWPSSSRSRLSTRSPTCASRASTSPSSQPTTSPPRSPALMVGRGRRRARRTSLATRPASTAADETSSTPGLLTYKATAAPDIQQRQRTITHTHRSTSMTETVNGPTGSASQARRQGQQERCCPEDRARLHDRGRAPVRRRHLGASRRRPDQLEDRRDRLRAARRGVPRLLERQRLHDRHDQVLPRCGRLARARDRASSSCSTASS